MSHVSHIILSGPLPNRIKGIIASELCCWVVLSFPTLTLDVLFCGVFAMVQSFERNVNLVLCSVPVLDCPLG